MQNLRYPFSRSFLIFSIAVTVVSILFAVIIFKDERNIVLVEQPIFISIQPLLLYFVATLLVTCISLAVKIRLYASDDESFGGVVESPEKIFQNFQRNLILIYVLVITVIVIIPVLAILIPGIFWLTGLTSFISGINISEIIIYFLTKKLC